jgi:hypothetical protein
LEEDTVSAAIAARILLRASAASVAEIHRDRPAAVVVGLGLDQNIPGEWF